MTDWLLASEQDFLPSVTSYDAAVPWLDDESFLSLVEPRAEPTQHSALEAAEAAALVRRALRALPRRPATVLRHRLGFGGARVLTLDELGARFGLCRERTRQIEATYLPLLEQLVAHLLGRGPRPHIPADCPHGTPQTRRCARCGAVKGFKCFPGKQARTCRDCQAHERAEQRKTVCPRCGRRPKWVTESGIMQSYCKPCRADVWRRAWNARRESA